MALRSSSFTQFAISLILAASVLTGCKTSPKRSGGTSGAPNSGGVHTPEAPPDTTAPPPLPTVTEAKKVAVILGPGGAKTFAHVGVLKGLLQQRLPVAKIVGLEWGALVGGLYAVNGQIHEVEWKLYKMEQAGLPAPKGFFAKKVGEESVSVMNRFLEESFGKNSVSASKVPFVCPSRSIWTGVVVWQNRGSYKDAIQKCLNFPPSFKVQGTFIAGPSQAAEAIALLRNEGFNLIVLVNVLGSGLPVANDSLPDNLNHVILWQEIKRSIGEAGKMGVEVINVDTSSYPMVQFAAKKDLISLGESAGQKAGASLVQKYGF